MLMCDIRLMMYGGCWTSGSFLVGLIYDNCLGKCRGCVRGRRWGIFLPPPQPLLPASFPSSWFPHLSTITASLPTPEPSAPLLHLLQWNPGWRKYSLLHPSKPLPFPSTTVSALCLPSVLTTQRSGFYPRLLSTKRHSPGVEKKWMNGRMNGWMNEWIFPGMQSVEKFLQGLGMQFCSQCECSRQIGGRDFQSLSLSQNSKPKKPACSQNWSANLLDVFCECREYHLKKPCVRQPGLDRCGCCVLVGHAKQLQSLSISVATLDRWETFEVSDFILE